MKVEESTLQNILKAYGKSMKPRKNKLEVPKNDTDTKQKISNKLEREDLNIINYDKDGNIAIDNKKKDALIDFFQ